MKSQTIAVTLAALLALTAAPAGHTQPSAAIRQAASALPAVARLPAKAHLQVTSNAFSGGGDIPFENTQYRGNTFPGLAWSAGPHGTRSFAIIMQDMDVLYRGAPILHWSIYNIPANAMALALGMTAPPAGASYGPNYKGAGQPYLGPRTPPGPKHHYHFQVFALDASLPDGAGASYDALIGAMGGHVLASGEVVGLGQSDPTAPPPVRSQ